MMFGRLITEFPCQFESKIAAETGSCQNQIFVVLPGRLQPAVIVAYR